MNAVSGGAVGKVLRAETSYTAKPIPATAIRARAYMERTLSDEKQSF